MVQVAKDKILEDRLRQRMSGSLKPMYSTAPEDRKAPPKEFRLPAFMDDFAQLPKKGEVVENALVFGAISLLPVRAPLCMLRFACFAFSARSSALSLFGAISLLPCSASLLSPFSRQCATGRSQGGSTYERKSVSSRPKGISCCLLLSPAVSCWRLLTPADAC